MPQIRWTKHGHQCLSLPDVLLYDDIECNPGPTEKRPKCVTCNMVVRRNQAPSCDSCFHVKCSGLSKDVLDNIYNSFDTWLCLTCSLPAFSDSFFDSSISSTNDSIVNNSLVMNNNEDPDIWKILSQHSAKHCVIGSFNINSLGNKFSEMMEWIQAFDILTIQETKLDKSFPDSQFAIDG